MRYYGYELTYRMENNEVLVSYTDSDYVGKLDIRKSTLGYVSMDKGGPISWR